MEDINICRPGFGASCALCCGSHNFNGTREDIEITFRERTHSFKTGERMTGNNDMHETFNALFTDMKHEKKIDEGIQCSFVGFTGIDGEIGCLAYNNQGPFTDADGEFFIKTCKIFSCRARDELTAGEIRFAAELMHDWYYYSLLIHEIPMLRDLIKRYSTVQSVTEERLSRIQTILICRLKEVPL